MVAVLVLGACAKNIQNKEAVRAAIFDHLNASQAKTGLNMSAMDMDVTTLAFSGNEARATVFFRVKSGDGGGGMSMNCVLDRKGDHWVFRGWQESGANPHGAGQALPAAPPDHPSMGEPASKLPPGHPPIGSKE
jgi:hypothetical protein